MCFTTFPGTQSWSKHGHFNNEILLFGFVQRWDQRESPDHLYTKVVLKELGSGISYFAMPHEFSVLLQWWLFPVPTATRTDLTSLCLSNDDFPWKERVPILPLLTSVWTCSGAHRLMTILADDGNCFCQGNPVATHIGCSLSVL